MDRFRLWPEQASSVAASVDALTGFLIAITLFFTILIAGLIIVYMVRFRRRSPDEVPAGTHASYTLEILWSVVPLAIAMVLFGWGARIYVAMARVPPDALQVYVVGKQWMWKAQHLEGRREIDELHVPVGRAVHVILTSEDVTHSFYVPAFRVKMDAVPGRYTGLWFQATKAGEYHLFCAEYCGMLHSRMIGRIVAMEPSDYQAWLSGGSGVSESLGDIGARIFQQQGCAACHSNQSGARGPSLVGVPGSTVTLADGRRVVADDDYLRESIMNPQAKIVAGYQPIMPTFQGLISEEDVLRLMAYLKTIRPGPNPDDGPRL